LKFYVIGDKAPSEVVALGNENVIIAGYQPEVRTYFDTMKLSVAPLRFGAGVKGKINQSMGLGVPVVATSLAVEGMSLQAGKDIMVADTPTAFAEAIIKVYSSESDWKRLSENGREKTRALFSPAAARKQLRRLLAERGDTPRTMHVEGQDYLTTPAMS
jgi:glycosyltransferase involved in cell wall biosynthesis